MSAGIVGLLVGMAIYAGIHKATMPQAWVETANPQTLHIAGEFIESNLGSAVEADGSVRPCFFQTAIGNIRRTPFETLVSRNLPAFRRSLDVGANPVCVRCVCSLKTSWRHSPWRQ